MREVHGRVGDEWIFGVSIQWVIGAVVIPDTRLVQVLPVYTIIHVVCIIHTTSSDLLLNLEKASARTSFLIWNTSFSIK